MPTSLRAAPALRLAPLLVLAAGLVACAPSVYPLYRDYEAPAGSAAPADSASRAAVLDGIRAALAEAGWTPAPADAPGIVATAPRTVSDWGFYRTEVALDVAPLGGRYVRVFFHPYRRYFTGSRSKLPYLGGALRRRLLGPLDAALASRGLVALGTPRERDEETAEAAAGGGTDSVRGR